MNYFLYFAHPHHFGSSSLNAVARCYYPHRWKNLKIAPMFGYKTALQAFNAPFRLSAFCFCFFKRKHKTRNERRQKKGHISALKSKGLKLTRKYSSESLNSFKLSNQYLYCFLDTINMINNSAFTKGFLTRF